MDATDTLQDTIHTNHRSLYDPSGIDTESQTIITKATAKAAALATIPIPSVDVLGITIVQTQMLSQLHGLHSQREADMLDFVLPAVISACATGLITDVLTSVEQNAVLSSLLPTSAMRAGVAGLLTQAVGELFALHYAHTPDSTHISAKDIGSYLMAQWHSDRYATDQLISGVMGHLSHKYL